MATNIALLLLFLFPIRCCCSDCGPAFCGNLNISYPFRLKDQPRRCGHRWFELECENNNRTTVVLRQGKFFVQQISYENYTMRLVDAGLETYDCYSLPLSSVYPSSVHFIPSCKNQYGTFPSSSSSFYYYPGEFSIVYLVNCTKPIKSSFYIDASRCTTNSSTSSLPASFFYFLDGKTQPADLHQSCTVKAEIPIMVKNIAGMSTMGIHKKLSEGFSVSWDYYYYYYTSICSNQVSFPDVLYKVEENMRIHRNKYVEVTVGVILLRTFPGILFLLALVMHKWRIRHLSMDDVIEEFLQTQNNLVPIRYSFKEIKKMTRSFKDKLGEGGFGSVYKGKLRSGHHVAVKLLCKSKGNGQDFINEVASIGRIHHTNVAKLVGFCVEGSKQALVYDFMSNGSLDKIIFTDKNKNSFGWTKMFDIVLGVARGIDYLHQGCNMQILHFDIKPHNILLDENFNPKISDFGLAKLYSVDDSIVSLTAARGTIGYMAPELVFKNLGGISYKADVYNFGMLLMEMIGRRKNLNAFADHSSQIYFPSWIYDQLDQEEDFELGDVSDAEKVMVRKMLITAF